MKINKFFTRKGGMILAGMVLMATSLTSCLKDNGPGSVDFSKSPALVAFQYVAGSATPYTAAIPNKSTTLTNLEVTLSVSTITLKSPVTVSVVPDDAGATAYIDADTASDGSIQDHILPTSEYTIANGGKVTINPGQQIVTVPITYAGDQIDFSQNYILGLKLVDASGAQLTSNLNNAIMVVTLKSIYAGNYSVAGSLHDVLVPTISGDGIYPLSVQLRTVNALSVIMYDSKEGYYHEINSAGQLSVYGNFVPTFVWDTNGHIVSVNDNYYAGNSQSRAARLDNTGTNAVLSGTPGVVGFKFQVSYVLTAGGTDKCFFNETYTLVSP